MSFNIEIITGLAGGGKTTLAKKQAERPKYALINMDQFRYTNSTDWIRVSLKDFRERILSEIQKLVLSKAYNGLVMEGSYRDHNDVEQARVAVINEIVSWHNTTVFGVNMNINLILLKPLSLEDIIERIVHRSIGRALHVAKQRIRKRTIHEISDVLDEELGSEVLGNGVETSRTVTRLILKTVNGYNPNVEALKSLEDMCAKASIKVILMDSYRCP